MQNFYLTNARTIGTIIGHKFASKIALYKKMIAQIVPFLITHLPDNSIKEKKSVEKYFLRVQDHL